MSYGINKCGRCRAQDIEKSRTLSWENSRLILMTVSASLLLIGLVLHFILEFHLFAEIFFLITAALTGYSIAKEGIYSLILHRRMPINLLIVVAAIGSFIIGHGEEGAAILLLFFIAEYLEENASERARRSIRLLMEFAPEKASVKINGEERTIDVHEVKVGNIIVVRPGEKIPLDGVVVRGVSSVNQAPITGESIPVTKRVGDEVYAGSINNEGYLEIKVTKPSTETVIAKIVRLIEEAQRARSPTERFIDRFSKYYTPSIMLLAAGIAAAPFISPSLSFNEWLYKALVLLVISCPCALAISTPTAMVSAITSAARNGVLIKGGAYVEAINRVGAFAFDKTGTLTEGRLEVADVIGFNHSEEEVLVKAASLEALSEHPIAKAIVKKARDMRLGLLAVDDFKSVAGMGVVGKIDGKVYYVGNLKFISNVLSDKFQETEVNKLREEGKTLVFIADEKGLIGLIAVMDRIRDSAFKAIRFLKERGIKTIMITGDDERTARSIAAITGVDEYFAGLLPDEKVRVIEKLAETYGSVTMVGDGVNDAPALAKADVGIAMGAIGSDISLETADIALMEDDLSKIPYLVKLSKKTVEVVRENISASILIKGAFAILTFPGLITLWLAVAVGDMGLSLAVILNAMRLSQVRDDISATSPSLKA